MTDRIGTMAARFARPARGAAASLLVLASLAGCAATDTYSRPGTWHPDGANAVNIAAMAAHPEDLMRGRGTPGSDGTLAADAIDRLGDGTAPEPGAGQAAGGQAGGPSGFAAPLLPASGPSGSP